jgi:hypothetical protein
LSTKCQSVNFHFTIVKSFLTFAKENFSIDQFRRQKLERKHRRQGPDEESRQNLVKRTHFVVVALVLVAVVDAVVDAVVVVGLILGFVLLMLLLLL